MVPWLQRSHPGWAGTAQRASSPAASPHPAAPQSQGSGSSGPGSAVPLRDCPGEPSPSRPALESTPSTKSPGWRGQVQRGKHAPRGGLVRVPPSCSAARREPWADQQLAEKSQRGGNSGTSLHSMFQLRQGSARPRGSDCLSFRAAAEVPCPQVQRGDRARARPCQREYTKYTNVHLSSSTERWLRKGWKILILPASPVMLPLVFLLSA